MVNLTLRCVLFHKNYANHINLGYSKIEKKKGHHHHHYHINTNVLEQAKQSILPLLSYLSVPPFPFLSLSIPLYFISLHIYLSLAGYILSPLLIFLSYLVIDTLYAEGYQLSINLCHKHLSVYTTYYQ